MNASEKFLQNWIPWYRNTHWHHAYSTLNGIKSVEYIPEELFFVFIEPVLNNKSLKNAYADKNSYSLIFGMENLPETVFKLVNGVFYTEEANRVESIQALEIIAKYNENLVLKPAIFSGGGKNVVIGPGKETARLLNENPVFKSDSYIIQRLAKQHPLMKQFHPDSLNTLRIMTARVKNDIVVLSSYFN